MNINDILLFAEKQNASDIHLTAGHPPYLRVLGKITAVRLPAITADEVSAMLSTMMSYQDQDTFLKHKEVDFAFEHEKQRYRVNAFLCFQGPAMVLRHISTNIPTLSELQTPPIIEKLCDLQKGLILITGPTGSGKSSSVAAMIDHINRHKALHIITLEDPIEFVHPSHMSLVHQRSLGLHTRSYESALRSAMREDPDIIVVGEMRDRATAEAALSAAETGHLVLATAHTTSAVYTVERMIDMFSEAEQPMARSMLANNLQAIVAQRLIPRMDQAKQIASFEILVCTSGIRHLIRENKLSQIDSLIQVGKQYGMQTMASCIQHYLQQGWISKEVSQELLQDSTHYGKSAPQDIAGSRDVF
jgi:twitching motility protein PilT